MKKIILFTLIVICSVMHLKAQINVSGYVCDDLTKEVLINAAIFDTINYDGTVTNNQGYFSISTKSGILRVSYIGYETEIITFNLLKDTVITIELEKSFNLLNKVEIIDKNDNTINISKLDIDDIFEIPSLGAQADVLKSAQILPGIQTQTEASSMLIVRGGDPGQNMFLLDGTPLIYVNHLGGFMSVFNPDMINDIKIYKGGFPAKYGGKLSSIIDISQRTGDASGFKGSFGIGLTDMNFSLEGKIGEKLTYITTARKTLFDIPLYIYTSIADMTTKGAYGFYDANFKLSWNVNKKNKVFFNVFQGDDYLYGKDKNLYVLNESEEKKIVNKNVWGNLMLSSTWNCIVKPKIFARTSLSYTRYRIKDKSIYESLADDNYLNVFKSTVNTVKFNSIWNISAYRFWDIEAGFHSSYIYNMPYYYKVEGANNSNEKQYRSIFNNSLSINNDIDLSKRIKLDAGLRLVSYYTDNNMQFSVEPRIELNFDLKKWGNINVNYMHVSQESQLLITKGNIKTNEIWIPASENIPVSTSQQYSISWNKLFYNNMFDFGVGVYNKDMQNLVTAKEDFSDIKGLADWENTIEKGGVGNVYGLEASLKKTYGKWTGMLSYHYSQSTRQFDNINNGNTYLYEYNRPHDFSLFIKRKINDKWSFSIVWHYKTGLPYTPAIGRYMTLDPISGNYYEAFVYGDRNSETMKDYHRLDLGFKYTTFTKRRKMKEVWTFSIYNAYNRQNPYYYYYNKDEFPGMYVVNTFYNEKFEKLDLYQISLFPIIFSVSYKIYFNKDNFKKTSIKEWLRHDIGKENKFE